MANSTSASLKLTVQQTGENSGTWGQFTNTNLLILEQAIGGYDAVGLNATTGATLTFSNGVLSNGKNQATSCQPGGSIGAPPVLTSVHTIFSTVFNVIVISIPVGLATESVAVA